MLITAGAGYGKSALLEAHCPEGGVVLPALTLVSSGLPEGASWIGVDDFDQVGVDDQARLIGLLAETQDVGVAIASRSPIGAAVRGIMRGRLSERDATDLALTPYAIARLLRDESGVTDPEAALRVAELTAGWPKLVHFAGDALSRDNHVDLAAALTAPGAPAADWILVSVLGPLPPGVEDVLRAVAGIDGTGPLTQSLCDAIVAEAGGEGVPDLVERLRHAGLLVPSRRVGRMTEVVMVPAVARVLRRSGPPAQEVAAVIAREYEAQRAWLPAARAYLAAGEAAAAARLVGERGEDILRRGDAGAVTRLVDLVREGALDSEPELLQRTYADALRMSGDPSRARRAFAPLVVGAGKPGGRLVSRPG